MVQTIQQTTEILLLLFDFRWSMSCHAGRAVSPVQVVKWTVMIPQSQLVEKIVVAPEVLTLFVDMPVCATTGALGLEVQKTAVTPQLQFITFVDQLRVDRALLSYRSCSSGLLQQPLVFGSHLYGVRCSPLEYRTMDISGSSLQNFPYDALLGSTVDTCLASVYEAFWKNFTHFIRECGTPVPEVDCVSLTSSSRSSCGRARRRQRQWFVSRWLRWFSSSRAVSPSSDGKLMLSSIMGAMDEKDTYAVAAPVVDSGGGMCYAGIAGCGSPRGMFPSVVVFPKMVHIVAGMTRRTVFCEHGTLSVDSGSGMCKAWFACLYTSRCSLTWLAGPDAQHLGRYEPEGLFRALHCCSHARCVQRQVPWLRGAENCGFSAVAANLQGRRLPCRAAEAHPMIQLFSRPS